MSGRRHRIAARPNLARAPKAAAKEDKPSAKNSNDEEKSAAPNSSSQETVTAEAGKGTSSNPSDIALDKAATQDSTPDAPPANVMADSTPVSTVVADSTPASSVVADSTQSTALADTDSDQQVKGRRRAKIQAKPMLSRKPRATPTSTADGNKANLADTAVDVVDTVTAVQRETTEDKQLQREATPATVEVTGISPPAEVSVATNALTQDNSMAPTIVPQDSSMTSPALPQNSSVAPIAALNDNSAASIAALNDNYMVSPDDNSMVPPNDNSMISSQNSFIAPVAAPNDSSILSPQDNPTLSSQDVLMPSPRQFKPRTKPNVIEAGKARMRRLSESLDLSPHLTASRRTREPSISGGDNHSESTVRVEPVNAQNELSTTFLRAEEIARSRQGGDEGSLAEIDRETIEYEHLEVMSDEPPKAKRTRKVRRLVKSDEAPDTSKMTIKDLIYFQPTSNPLPPREIKKVSEKPRSTDDPKDKNAEEDDGTEQAADDTELDMAPQVMVGEDGQVIINERSLTVEQSTNSLVDYEDITVDRDGEGATYSSFRPNNSKNSKMWTATETGQFYKALSAIGTDFSLMCQLFPKRSRADLKKKFKKEERTHLPKVELALRGKLNFNAEPFPEHDIEKERELRKQEKQANKKDLRKRRGGDKMRTYYDVNCPDDFRNYLSAKRRGVVRPHKDDTSTEASHETTSTVEAPPRKLLKLNTQSKLQDTSSNNLTTNQNIAPVNTRPTLIPQTSSDKPPMPSISTMLDQNPSINNKISNLLLSKQTPLHPPVAAPKSSDLVLSPLYKLDNGDSIMVSTKHIRGTDKKVHHLYLYTAPKPGGSGIEAMGSLDPINFTVQPKAASHSTDIVPEAGIVSRESDSTSQVSLVDGSCTQISHEQSSLNLTKLVTPKSVRTTHHSGQVQDSQLESHSVVTAIPKVPTRQLDWKLVDNGLAEGTVEKELAFTDL